MSETGRKPIIMGKAVPAILVIFTLLLISGVASAATRVVNQTALPCFTSPEGFYYATIQAAIDAAGEGDTIIVCPGTYNENIWINKSRLTVKSHAGRAQTFIQSAAANLNIVTIRDATEVTLDDFTIRDAWGVALDVAGISMDNVSKSTIANNLVINITDQIDAYGITVNNSNNNSFITNLVTNISGGADAAGIVLGASPNNSFSATSVKNVSANGSAYGIVLVISENNTFDTWTDVAYIYSSGLVGTTNGEFIGDGLATELETYDVSLDGAMACGIFLVESHFNSFIDRTKVSYVRAECSEAAGILLLYSFFNTFNDNTDVSYIFADGFCGTSQASEDLFDAETATREDFEQALDGSIAVGIKLALSWNNTFNDKVKVSYINGSNAACGVVLFILADNNEFHRCTISDLYSASPDTTLGVLMLVSGDNFFAAPKISAGNGPMIDCGVLLGWSWNNTIQDGEIADSMVGILITALGIQPLEGPPNCYNTISGNWIHANGIGIWLLYEWENDILGNTIEDNGDGVLVSYSFMNSIEENMIRNNKGAGTGVHIDANSDNNCIHGNCFFYNEPYQAWDDFVGFSNHWDGNYWEPAPGPSGDPYLIPGTAGQRDNAPLRQCPLCAQVPAQTPLGIAALIGLLSLSALSIIRKKRG